MNIQNTRDYPFVPNINMLVYGRGGVGKSTFGSTFPKALFLDFENGVKYFKQRGIEVPVVQFDSFPTHKEQEEIIAYAKKDSFDSIVIDPIGEAMEKLIKDTNLISGQKYRQSNGDLTMAGWGKVKDEMRSFIKRMRDTGKNILIVAHTTEEQDGEVLKQRPLIATKLVDELIAIVDIVGYLDVITAEGEDTKRIIRVNAADSRFDAKDRTGTLPSIVKPEYGWIYEKIVSSQKTQEGTEESKNDTPIEEPVETPQEAVQDEPEPVQHVNVAANPFKSSK